MKKIVAAAFLTAALCICLSGCGGDSGNGALSLLMESSRSMSEVSGYRMRGSLDMSAEGSDAGGGTWSMVADIEAEVQVCEGEMRQHMTMTMDGEKIDSYIIGDEYYQHIPGQGWMRMHVGAYKTQNLGMGLMDPEEMELMAGMASKAEVIEEGGEEICLSFHLDEDFFKASLEISRRYLEEGGQAVPDEWLKQAEEAVSSFQADIRIWLWQESKLIDRIETAYTMGGVSPVGDITNSMQLQMYDYNQDIEVELPPEAEGAEEFNI